MAINLSTLVNPTNPLQLCKAWIQFNAAGTIIGSFNVSSLTKNSNGNFTVNLTSALAGASYSVGTGVSYSGTAGFNSSYCVESLPLTSSTFGVYYYAGASSAIYSAQVFGN